MANKVVKFESRKHAVADPLEHPPVPPERVHYATGMLLDAEDFRAEQTYHRAQLARALGLMNGSGTIAGLNVTWRKAAPNQPEEIHVEAGVAIDSLGRLIVVSRPRCLRLGEWFDEHAEVDQRENRDHLKQAFFPDVEVAQFAGDTLTTAKVTGVVANLFLRLQTCERGKSPVFATGPFDTLDAVEPSRLREEPELKLVLVKTIQPTARTLPTKFDLQDLLQIQKTILEWQDPTVREDLSTDVFLARIVLPAAQTAPTAIPQRAAGDVRIDNHIRPFIYSLRALAQWLKL
ncbi:MAG TPA: hypothetical protein VFZ34_13180 [Blastocatellia bacterium]|nr:hypothetical protein [Blastocatellia bacterium]